MERIVLEVDSTIAKAWRNVEPSVRADYEEKISSILQELKEAEFLRHLDEIGKIAESNGLTEDILNQLLNEED